MNPTVNFSHKDKTIEQLVKLYWQAFAPRNHDEDVNRCGGHSHHITLKEGYRVHQEKPRKLSPLQKEALKKQLQTYLDRNWIRPSESSWASGVFLVPKKTVDKEGHPEFRLVIDYRCVNDMSIRQQYPMRGAAELFQQLQGKKVFSCLDFESGYHHIPMDSAARYIAAFMTPFGLFEPNVLMFGLHSAPATFQGMMESNFKEEMESMFASIYLDDMMVHDIKKEDHYKHLESIFQKVIKLKMTLRLSKCLFAQPKVEYLGHIVSHNSLQVDPRKIEAIKHFSRPQSIRQLQRWLGMCNYYSMFIRQYHMLVAPLFSLLKGHSKTNCRIQLQKEELQNFAVNTIFSISHQKHPNNSNDNTDEDSELDNSQFVVSTTDDVTFVLDPLLSQCIKQVNTVNTEDEDFRMEARKVVTTPHDTNTGKGKRQKVPIAKKDDPIWGEEQEKSFIALKEAMCSAPVLAIPNPWEPYEIFCDASSTTLGAILEQNGRVVEYWSKCLSLTQQLKYSTYQKEAMALAACLKRWRHYIDNGKNTTIFCDNSSLCKILQQKSELDRFQQKVLLQIGGLNVEIVHTKSEDEKADPFDDDNMM